MLKGVVSMGFFKKFSAPKANIELKLNEVAYEYTDKLTGRIVLDPQEDISINEFRLEFSPNPNQLHCIVVDYNIMQYL